MLVDFRRKTTAPRPLRVLGEDVDMEEEFRVLGVSIDNRLNWKANINAVDRKGRSQLFLEETQILPCVQQDVGDVLPVL